MLIRKLDAEINAWSVTANVPWRIQRTSGRSIAFWNRVGVGSEPVITKSSDWRFAMGSLLAGTRGGGRAGSLHPSSAPDRRLDGIAGPLGAGFGTIEIGNRRSLGGAQTRRFML